MLDSITPAELHLLGRPDLGGPAFFVRDDGLLLLQKEEGGLGRRAVEEALELQRGGRLRAAGMSRGAGRWADSSYRGDEMAWLVPGGSEPVAAAVEEKKQEGVPTLQIPKGGALHAVVGRLDQLARKLDGLDGQSLLELGGGLKKSVQLAYYPGGGHRYVRHRDAFPAADAADKDGGAREATRCLTVICYLNPDWRPEHGGRLRLYLPPGASSASSSHLDVDPLLGRVVVFRSDAVEHEVLPAWASRMALTCWFYGRPRHAPPRLSSLTPAAPLDPATSSSKETALSELVGGGDDAASEEVEAANGALWTTTAPPLPLDDAAAQEEDAEDTIFVSVAAYRDPECQHTLHSLFSAARHPERVFVGLVWQGDGVDDDARCLDQRPLPPRWAQQVRMLRMDHREAAGPCWARHLAQALWQGERFLLQIDSHMRLRPNWDAYLIRTLTGGGCGPDRGRRAVLTTYPIGYELVDDDGAVRMPTDVRPTLLCPSKFDGHGLLRQAARRCVTTHPSPIPSVLWASGFSFSWAAPVLAACPYDPSLRHLFFGEEVSMAARLWTHGFDLWAPGETVLYHLWTRAHRPSFRQGPRDPARAAAEEAAARRRVLRLLGTPLPPESQQLEGEEHEQQEDQQWGSRYGLGNVRTLAEFEELVGVDFRRGLFRSSAALWGGQEPGFFDREGPGGVWGAEEQGNSGDNSDGDGAGSRATPALSAAAAGVMGTQNLSALVSSFLKT